MDKSSCWTRPVEDNTPGTLSLFAQDTPHTKCTVKGILVATLRRAAALLLIALMSIFGCNERGADANRSDAVLRKVKLDVASEFQSSLPVLGTTIVHLAKRLEVASGGTMTMKVYEPGEMVPKLESLSAVSEGKVDVACSASGYWAGKMPAAPLFSSVPFGPEVSEYLAWMRQGNGLKLYQQMYDRYGYKVKVLICGVVPPETSGWFANPINSADDLRGLNMRFYGLGGRVMEKLGVAVTMLSSAEIFQAWKRA